MSTKHQRLLCASLSFLFSISLACVAHSQVTVTGDVSPSYDGSDPWDMGDNAMIGIDGIGSVEVEQGSGLISNGTTIGVNAGSSGSVLITGQGSTWTENSAVFVGDAGEGTLTIADRALFNVGTLLVSGVATVQGTGTTLNGTGSLVVGRGLSQTATMNILDGATASQSGTVSVGFDFTSRGQLNIDGIGSSLTAAGDVVVGVNGVGELNVTNGGLLTVAGTSLNLGTGPASSGTVNVIGAGSVVDSASFTIVGFRNSGVINVLDGGRFNASQLVLGSLDDDDRGEVTVSGAGAILDAAGIIDVGDRGTGRLDVLNGGTVLAGNVFIGESADSIDNQVNVSGIGSSLQVVSQIRVGNVGGGSLRIDDGATVTSAQGVVASEENTTGDVLVSGSGTRWDIESPIVVGLEGTGSIRIENGAQVTSRTASAGLRAGANGSLVISGAGSSLTTQFNTVIGDEGVGNLVVEDGGSIELLANNAQLFVGENPGSVGTVLISGEGSRVSTPFFQMNNGSLTIEDGGELFIKEGGNVSTVLVIAGEVSITGGRVVFEDTDGLTRFAFVPAINFTGGEIVNADLIQSLDTFVQDGGTIRPGDFLGITEFIQTDYEFNRGVVALDLFGVGEAGVEYDQIIVGGTIDLIGSDGLANSDLEINLGYAAEIGDVFTIFDNDDVDLILGEFAQGSEIIVSFQGRAYTFDIDYFAGTGNDITLTVSGIAVPEPSTLFLLGAGMALVATRRRKN